MLRTPFGTRSRAILVFTAVAANILSGCRDAMQPIPTANPAQLRSEESPAAMFETLDDEFARLAGTVPGGFAGMYFDNEGKLVVALVDVAQRDAALVHLDETIRQRRVDHDKVALSAVEFRAVEFRYDDLKRWRDQLDGAARQFPSLAMSDIDEVANQSLWVLRIANLGKAFAL